MPNHLRRASFLLASSACLASCSTSVTSPSQLPDCTGPVTLTVTEGTTPTFDWTPACRGHFLNVLMADPLPPGAISGNPAWYVQARAEVGNTFGPAIRYGVVPPDAQSPKAAEPLVKGQRYMVVLWRSVSPSEAVVAGQVGFTP